MLDDIGSGAPAAVLLLSFISVSFLYDFGRYGKDVKIEHVLHHSTDRIQSVTMEMDGFIQLGIYNMVKEGFFLQNV